MASILSGDSEHKSFAPLTGTQTVQICQHLQSLVTALEGKVDDLHRSHIGLDSKVDRLNNALRMNDAAVATIKENFLESQSSIAHIQNDFQSISEGIGYVHKGLDQTNDSVNALHVGLKLANTNAGQLKEDLQTLKGKHDELEDTVMANDGSDLAKLSNAFNITRQAVNQLMEESARTQSALQQEKDILSRTTQELMDTQTAVARTDKVILGLEEMIHQAKSDSKSTRTTLEETNAVILKIHDDHEDMKNLIKATRKNIGEYNVKFNRHQMEIEKNAQKMDRMTGDMAQTNATVQTQVKALETTSNHIRSLKEGFQMHSASIDNVTRGIEHVGAMALMTKTQIHETNQLLLPNLQIEGDNPASQGGMTMMSTASMGASSAAQERSMAESTVDPQQSRSSSRGPKKRSARLPEYMKKNAWLLRNIGTSADRMAMI